MGSISDYTACATGVEMGRFRSPSRRDRWRGQRQWLRQNARILVTFAAGLVGLIAITTALLVVALPGGHWRWYALGVAHAAVLAAGLQVLRASFVPDEPETIWQAPGASSEERTREVLAQATRRQLIWGWVDSITTQDGDIDHLILTRAGRLVVLDSRWRHQANRANVAEITRSARRAHTRAQGVAQSVVTRVERDHPGELTGRLAVRPAVVLWGAAQHAVPDGTQIEGVAFVPGVRLLGWLKAQGGEPLSKRVAVDVLEALEEFRTAAWQDPGEDRPSDPA